MMRLILVPLVLLAALPARAQISSSGYVAPYNGFFVAPNGNDNNAGTINAPFATLVKAQSAMRSSATKVTFVRAGTYAPSSAGTNCSTAGDGLELGPQD